MDTQQKGDTERKLIEAGDLQIIHQEKKPLSCGSTKWAKDTPCLEIFKNVFPRVCFETSFFFLKA